MNNQEPAWKNFVQSVTPELAEEWLRLHANPRNRKVKVSDSRVQSWAREQRAGAWKINPFAPIGFATGGMLLNGHNRLTAQTVSRVTCGYVVFYDVPEEVLRVTDTGKPRTHQQIARMFRDETDMHSAYKVIEIVRQRNEFNFRGKITQKLRIDCRWISNSQHEINLQTELTTL